MSKYRKHTQQWNRQDGYVMDLNVPANNIQNIIHFKRDKNIYVQNKIIETQNLIMIGLNTTFVSLVLYIDDLFLGVLKTYESS